MAEEFESTGFNPEQFVKPDLSYLDALEGRSIGDVFPILTFEKPVDQPLPSDETEESSVAQKALPPSSEDTELSSITFSKPDFSAPAGADIYAELPKALPMAPIEKRQRELEAMSAQQRKEQFDALHEEVSTLMRVALPRLIQEKVDEIGTSRVAIRNDLRNFMAERGYSENNWDIDVNSAKFLDEVGQRSDSQITTEDILRLEEYQANLQLAIDFVEHYHPPIMFKSEPEREAAPNTEAETDIIEDLRASDLPEPEEIEIQDETEAKEKSWSQKVFQSVGRILSGRKFRTFGARTMATIGLLMAVCSPVSEAVGLAQKSQFEPTSVERVLDEPKDEPKSEEKEKPAEDISANQKNPETKAVSPENKLVKKLTEKVTEPLHFKKAEIVEDKQFIYPDSVLHTPDLVFRADRLVKEQVKEGQENRQEAQKYLNTTKLLLSAKQLWPQAVKFRIVEQNGQYSIKPLDWQNKVEVKGTSQADVVVLGNELESVTTAMAAADKGLECTLVYSGALGGLSSDTGANMRYFDAVLSAPMTQVHQKIIHEALGMKQGNEFSIPNNVNEKLESYLKQNYPQIKLVKTATFNSVHLEKSANAFTGLLTQEGQMIKATSLIDTTPEGVAAEKAGVPFTVETPNIGYGMVFDVKGLRQDDFRKMASTDVLNPDNILTLAGVSVEQVMGDKALQKAYERYKTEIRSNWAKDGPSVTYGYQALGNAYELYAKCLEYKAQGGQKQALHALNQNRQTSGFNIALRQGEATFNSLSYHFPKTVRQDDHDLYRDSQFAPLREMEIPMLEKYLQQVTQNTELKVVMPHQLYVRQAATAYETLDKYSANDFRHLNRSGLWMRYHNDLRNADARDEYDNNTNKVYEMMDRDFGNRELSWNIKPEAAMTQVKGLYLVSKSAAPPEFVGALRILQNLISTGSAVSEMIADRSAEEKYQSLMADKGAPAEPVQQTDGGSLSFVSVGPEDGYDVFSSRLQNGQLVYIKVPSYFDLA